MQSAEERTARVAATNQGTQTELMFASIARGWEQLPGLSSWDCHLSGDDLAYRKDWLVHYEPVKLLRSIEEGLSLGVIMNWI